MIFLDTGKLFPETLAYRDELVARLGLTDVRSIRPSGAQLAAYDPDGRLWQKDADLCCAIRKTNPLDEALEGFEAWITGRKRSQGGTRADLQMVETGPMGASPSTRWPSGTMRGSTPISPSMTCRATRCRRRAIPRSAAPPARQAAAPGEDKRSGRWAGLDKTECGIHMPRRAAAAQA